MRKRQLFARSIKKNFGVLKITALYLIFGSLWILFSDEIAAFLATDQAMLTTISLIKGWFFILTTTIFLFLLIRRETTATHLSEERFHWFLDATKDSYWDWDIQNNQVFFSPGFFSRWGYPIDISTADIDLWLNLIHPDDRGLVLSTYQKCIENPDEPFEVEYRLHSADGPWRWILDRGKIIQRNEIGKATRLISIQMDISERKSAEEANREQEAKYRLLAENMADVIWIYDIDLECFTYFSPSIFKLRGYSVEEALSQSLSDSVSASSKAYANELFRKRVERFRAGDPNVVTRTYDIEQPCKNGSTVWTQIKSTLIIGEDGRIRLIGISRDITRSKQVEDALRQRDELLSLVEEMAVVGGWEFDAITGNGYWTSGVAKIHDLDPSQETSKGFGLTFYRGKYRELIENSIRDAIEKAQPYDVELELITNNGAHKWVRTIGRPVVEKGQVVRVQGTFQDISNRKKAEDRLTIQANLLEQVSDAILSTDVNMNLTSWNNGAANLYGWTAEEVIGKHVGSIIKSDFSGITRDEVIRHIYQFGSWEGEVTQKRKDGSSINILESITLFKDNLGNPIGVIAVNHDITERIQSRLKVQATERQFHQLIDSMPQLVWTADADGHTDYFNQQYFQYRSSIPTIDGNNHWKPVIHSDDLPRTRERWRHSVKTGEVYQIEHRGQMVNGTFRWFLSRAVPIRDEAGKVIKWFGTSTDIDDTKQVEAKAKDAEERLRLAMDAAKLGIWTFDYRENKFHLDARSREQFNTQDENLSYAAFLEQLHPDDRIRVNQDHMRLVRENLDDQFSIVFRVTNEEGGYRVLSIRGSVQYETYGGKNHPVIAIGINSDITAAIQAEAALKQSEERFSKAFRSNPVPMLIVRIEDNKILDVNNSYIELTGFQKDQILDHNLSFVYDYVKPEDTKKIDELFTAQGFLDSFEMEIQTQNGKVRNVLMSIEKILLNNQACVLNVLYDITDRKVMEEELKRSNADLEQFAYVASHDLQEPLRAITGMVQLLQKKYQGKLDERGDQYIDLAVDAATRMHNLINDLLSFSRVSRYGKTFEPTNTEKALNMAVHNLAVTIHENEANITNDSLPVVIADPTQITLMFQNLISNAIKFHGADKPEIHVSAKKEKDEWIFIVKDNGIGIDPQYFERIFTVFQRLHTHREYPGTGIGLAICKKIAEQHGGRIWVESEPDTGSTFYFTIPHRKEPDGNKTAKNS